MLRAALSSPLRNGAPLHGGSAALRLARTFMTVPPLHQRARAIVYEDFGDPTKVLRGHTFDLPELAPGHVRVKWLTSSLNPADFNVVQGVYPSKPRKRDNIGTPNPSYVGGNEGVGEVVAVSDSSSTAKADFRPGDWVIPSLPQVGTWTSHADLLLEKLIRVERGKTRGKKKDIDQVEAATLMVNPATALCMLREGRVEEGDVIMQNGANSAVGQAVIQIAHKMGVETINFVRNRPDLPSLTQSLQSLGSPETTHVMTYSELFDSHNGPKQIKEWANDRQIKLALNCVCGKETTAMAHHLGRHGLMYTYGAMSMSPLTLPASLFIFKDITCKGFWMTRWYWMKTRVEREDLTTELVEMFERGELSAPKHSLLPVGAPSQSDEELGRAVREAVKKSMGGGSGEKIFLQWETVA